MLEPYQELLRQFREHPERWGELAYAPEPHPEWTRVDANFARRFGVLAALQYDRRPEDHALVRALFKQEVAARRDDPFQGTSPALHLGAFLLARYRDPADVPLFGQAKLANFDTYCGFDVQYLLAADRSAGLAWIADLPADVREGIRELFGDPPETVAHEELEVWWQGKQREFPEREEDEDPRLLAERAITLGAIEEGRACVDRWEAQQADDDVTLLSLVYLRDSLGQLEEALDAAEKLRNRARGDDWSYASALLRLPKYLVRLKRHLEAWEALQELRGLLERHPDWMKAGLARSATEETLDLAAADECPTETRRAAWEQGHELIRRGAESLVILRKATTVAGLVGAGRLEAEYRARAQREDRRIQAGLRGR